MGLMDLFKKANINEAVEECRACGGILLDVRTKEEFSDGHIEGAVNLPLDRITQAEESFPDFSVPLFVYCRSGARSSQAVAMLQQMGYEAARNIGGILHWKGELVR